MGVRSVIHHITNRGTMTNLKNNLRKIVPGPLWAILRSASWYMVDHLDVVTGRRDPLTPPARLMFIGEGDYEEVGKEFLRYHADLGGLRPEMRVLDVGCGIGRMAAPLTSYLSASGSYEGFDIMAMGIDWCARNISTRFPNFRFQHARIYNKMYDAGAQCRAADYVFPYRDSEFDYVFLTSVFTHMLKEDVAQYLSQIVRVLKPGGTCLSTYFLLNPETERLFGSDPARNRCPHPYAGLMVADPECPEQAVAYPEIAVRQLYALQGLRICEPIHYGSWCGRAEFLSYQDIVISKKT